MMIGIGIPSSQRRIGMDNLLSRVANNVYVEPPHGHYMCSVFMYDNLGNIINM